MKVELVCVTISVLIFLFIILEAFVTFHKRKKHTYSSEYHANKALFSEKCIHISYDELAKLNSLPAYAPSPEVEKFLVDTHFSNITGEHFWFCDNWETSSYVVDANLSEEAIETLQCLDSDINYIFSMCISLETDNEEYTDNYTALSLLLENKYSFSSELRYHILMWYRYCCK